jgi:hypothetical protein
MISNAMGIAASGNRTEREIFDELAQLCTSPGYAHAIAFFSYRDSVIGFGEELKAKDFEKLFSMDRLIRTEISTLIGLMARAPIDYLLPSPQKVQDLIEHTEALLKELHEALVEPLASKVKAALADPKKPKPFTSAEAMREPIFYGSESAYSFQYYDLAPKKYSRDEDWLRQNKGFSIGEAKQVVVAVSMFLNENLLEVLKALKGLPFDKWTILDGFKFSVLQIVAISKLPVELVEKVLSAFAFRNDGNPTFTALNEFNATNAYPLLKTEDGNFILFQHASLAEALYDTPFYWMADDKAYEQTAMANRGIFTETFAAERLELVFGHENVFRNIDIWQAKNRVGEIDALVLFANRAIVVQAKSKKLTLAARKGNDLQLQADFKGAVQDACNQAYACSQHLLSTSVSFTDRAGTEIKIPRPIKQIFQICVVVDHFPALSLQVRQFKKYTTTEIIQAPLVCDVFLLDVITEMLETPLRCLSYLDLRATAGDKVSFSHEIIALGYHLKQNLWLGEYDFIHMEDDIATDLHIAMAVRREGMKGERTPRGILTALRDTSVGRIVEEIETTPNALTIDLGFQLLKLSSDTAHKLSSIIDRAVSLAAKDGTAHDATIGLSEAKSGITVHCNKRPDSEAAPNLKRHCEIRKYSQKATTWFGLVVRPDGALRLGLMLNYPWEANEQLDKIVETMPKGLPAEGLRPVAKRGTRPGGKIGKNDPCPCGSGLKFKKCCLPNLKS